MNRKPRNKWIKHSAMIKHQTSLGKYKVIKCTSRKYIKGDRITVSVRMPLELKKVLDKIAKSRGHSLASFMQDGLDQWAYAHEQEQR